MLFGGLHPKPLKVADQAYVSVQSGGILVEVEKRTRFAVEDAALLLDERGARPKAFEEVFEFVESVSPRVAHI